MVGAGSGDSIVEVVGWDQGRMSVLTGSERGRPCSDSVVCEWNWAQRVA